MQELFNVTASFWYAFHVLSESYQFLRVRFQSQSIFLVCYSYLLQTIPIIPCVYPDSTHYFLVCFSHLLQTIPIITRTCPVPAHYSWYSFPVLSEPYQFTSQHPSGLILIVGTFLLFITSHTKGAHTGMICHSSGCRIKQ